MLKMASLKDASIKFDALEGSKEYGYKPIKILLILFNYTEDIEVVVIIEVDLCEFKNLQGL